MTRQSDRYLDQMRGRKKTTNFDFDAARDANQALADIIDRFVGAVGGTTTGGTHHAGAFAKAMHNYTWSTAMSGQDGKVFGAVGANPFGNFGAAMDIFKAFDNARDGANRDIGVLQVKLLRLLETMKQIKATYENTESNNRHEVSLPASEINDAFKGQANAAGLKPDQL